MRTRVAMSTTASTLACSWANQSPSASVNRPCEQVEYALAEMFSKNEITAIACAQISVWPLMISY